MGSLKAVFFDVEGTLWDGQDCARSVMEILLQRFASDLPEADSAECIRRFNIALLDLPRREHLRDARPFSRRQRFEAFLSGLNVQRAGLCQELSHTYDSVRRLIMRQSLRPDAIRVLAELGRRGLARGAVMNGAPAVQRHLLESLGLEPHLEHVVLGQVEGYTKPDARLFRRALELAGVEADEALYVGDSPLTDMLGAARAGVRTAWFDTGRRRMPRAFPEPDFRLTHLSELPSIVAGLT
jgi:putative hydrolase of the HAD superfamily